MRTNRYLNLKDNDKQKENWGRGRQGCVLLSNSRQPRFRRIAKTPNVLAFVAVFEPVSCHPSVEQAV